MSIASYLISGFSAVINFDVDELKQGWLVAFDLGNISYLIQLAYAIIALVRSLHWRDCSQLCANPLIVMDLHSSTLPSKQQPFQFR